MNKFTLISYIDLLFCLFAFFAVAFAIVYTEEKEKEKAGIEYKAEYIVTSNWKDNSVHDIDIWVRDPDGEMCFYQRKEPDGMTLDRDDQGQDPGIRQEIISIRTNKPGRYTINVMMYTDKYNGQNREEARVTVIKLNPFREIANRNIKLSVAREEITVVSFDVDEQGQISNIDSFSQYKMVPEAMQKGFLRDNYGSYGNYDTYGSTRPSP